MDPDHAMTCYFDLPGGRRVEVGMTVYEDPLFPTPNEPDVVRPPHLSEWAEVCGKLARLEVRMKAEEKAETLKAEILK